MEQLKNKYGSIQEKNYQGYTKFSGFLYILLLRMLLVQYTHKMKEQISQFK